MSKKDPYASYAKAYKIYTVQNSNYCWDSSKNPQFMNGLILVKPHGGQNQKFYLTPSIEGKWRIHCLDDGYCLRPDSQKQGNLYFAPEKGVSQQQWQLIQVKANTYIIKNCYGYVIDVFEQKYKNEAKLITYPQHSGKNQQWVLQRY